MDCVARSLAAASEEDGESPRWKSVVQENADMVSLLHNGVSRAHDIEERVACD